jgi:hypothetical protein
MIRKLIAWLAKFVALLVGFLRRRPQPASPSAPGPVPGGWEPRQPPSDRDNLTREPRPRSPHAGSAAVAVAEPEDDESPVTVVGRSS